MVGNLHVSYERRLVPVRGFAKGWNVKSRELQSHGGFALQLDDKLKGPRTDGDHRARAALSINSSRTA
jgi:hypothetical protein